jgi:hypothetical protein
MGRGPSPGSRREWRWHQQQQLGASRWQYACILVKTQCLWPLWVQLYYDECSADDHSRRSSSCSRCHELLH